MTEELVFNRVEDLYGPEFPPKSRKLVNYVLRVEMGLTGSQILDAWDRFVGGHYSCHSAIFHSGESFRRDLATGYDDSHRELRWVTKGIWDWDLGDSEMEFFALGTVVSTHVPKSSTANIPSSVKNRMIGVLKNNKELWSITPM